MTQPGNLLLLACVVVFTTVELYKTMGSLCVSSSFDDAVSSSSSTMEASSSPVTPKSSTRSHFHAAAADAYRLIHEHDSESAKQHQEPERTKFVVSKWKQTTSGGLNTEDREMLGRIYGNASSVFEFGLGESTYLASHVGVPRYSGIDSDAAWISMVRNNVSGSYRFYFADIGMTRDWGYPIEELKRLSTITKLFHSSPSHNRLMSTWSMAAFEWVACWWAFCMRRRHLQ